MATSFTGHAAHSLPSPAPSQATSNADGTGLPTARSHPLRPGSQKEAAFITYADAKILNINRRYAKKFSGEDDGGTGRGYESFAEVVSDLEAVFDVVWVSGTPLQIPYLLSVATLFCSYAEPFLFDPEPTFRMVGKLDAAFGTLLQSPALDLSNVDTRQRQVSLTDQVRIRSVAELTRLSLVEKLQNEERPDYFPEESEIEDEETSNDIESEVNGPSDRLNHLLQSTSELYIQTLEILGASLIPDNQN